MRNSGIPGFAALILALVLNPASASSQARGQGQGQQAPPSSGRPAPPNMPGNFTFIPKGAQEATLKTIIDGAPQDQAVRMVDTPTGHLGAYVLHYEPRTPAPGAPANAFYHSDITELYVVTKGAGTILLGGELANPTWGDPNGRAVKEISGPTANGQMSGRYTTQKIAAGDVFIVPPGVPHAMGYEVTTPLEILRIVIDPKRLLPAK